MDLHKESEGACPSVSCTNSWGVRVDVRGYVNVERVVFPCLEMGMCVCVSVRARESLV